MKFLKRFLIFVTILVVLVLLTAIIITSVFEGSIGKRLITEVNKNLKSELSIEKFDLTVLSTFPTVSANFRGVNLEDTQDGALLTAENLSMRFGLLSLLSSQIQVKSVVISNGALNIGVDKYGKPNYDIVAASDSAAPPSGDEEELNISLETARLENIELNYVDRSANQEIKGLVTDATFSGEFSTEEFSLDSEALLLSRYVLIDGKRFLRSKNIGYDARVNVNLKEGRYDFDKVGLEVESNRFRVDGSIESWENSTYFDLFLDCEKGSLGSVLRLLPNEYLSTIGEFKSKGKFIFNTTIKGEASKSKNPSIAVELSLNDGRVTHPKMEEELRDVSFIATFDNGGYHNNSSSVFEVKEFKGYFDRELVELGLRIEDLDDPKINFQADGIVPLKSVYGLLDNPAITDGGGELEVRSLKLDGRFEDMINTSRISRVNAGGQIEFDDAFLTINEEKILLDRGVLQLQDNTLSISELVFEGAGSKMEFNGSAFNLIPVLFAARKDRKVAELEFEAELKSEILDIDRLLKLSAVAGTPEEGTQEEIDSVKIAQIQKREKITDFLNGRFNAAVANYNFYKIEGKDFKGKLEFVNNELTIEGDTKAMNGTFDLDGHLYFEDEPRLRAKLICKDIDAAEFFKQTDNFGQAILTDKNIKGELESKMLIEAYWDEKGNFLDDKLKVLAGIGIQEGELVNFEMLENFSTFVKIKDLKRVKFTNMENFLAVRKRRLIIPAMFIQSNALNLTISGDHSFENEIQYNLKVNAGQVLVNRFKRHDAELTPKKARRNGWFNLYYSILGTIDDYNIKSARKRVKSDFELSEIRRREIREALEKEFGYIQLVEEPADWRDIPEYDAEGDPDDVEYIDWGEKKDGGDN
ncbi:MAG: AsmA family protein [Bacteroidota bacterium]